MTLSMGPQHPSTHGVLRFVVKADGEVMREAIPDVGYLHRAIEKIAEKVGYHGFMPYTDRIDYVAAMPCNQGWAMVCEKLAGHRGAAPGRVLPRDRRRAEPHREPSALGRNDGDGHRRVHARSPTRSASASTSTICWKSSAGRGSPSATCGSAASRTICRRLGGEGEAFLDRFEPLMEEYNDLISFNKIYVERLVNVAVISREDAIDYNLTGPNLRGSGVKFDVRKDLPYSIYPELEFDVPVGTGERGTLGDCFDRYMVRIREIQQSCRMLRQCLDGIPEGPVLGKVPRKFKPPAGDAYVRLEAARGDMGWYCVSDGTDYPHRVRGPHRARTPRWASSTT
jgi:NADH-quinone oxidoreductase subunit D